MNPHHRSPNAGCAVAETEIHISNVSLCACHPRIETARSVQCTSSKREGDSSRIHMNLCSSQHVCVGVCTNGKNLPLPTGEKKTCRCISTQARGTLSAQPSNLYAPCSPAGAQELPKIWHKESTSITSGKTILQGIADTHILGTLALGCAYARSPMPVQNMPCTKRAASHPCVTTMQCTATTRYSILQQYTAVPA